VTSSAPFDWGSLDFQPLADEDYPAFAAVLHAAEAGGNRGTILNAADEVAVASFLDGRIPFPAIADTIESAVERWGAADEPKLDEIVALDAEVRTTLKTEAA